MDITITAAAEKFIRRMLRFGGGSENGFRIVVTAGGCSGLAGDFSIETAPQAGDAVHEHNGMKFFLPAESRLLLDGVTVDFVDTATQTGLVFHAPKGVNCGCSTAPKDALPGVASVAISRIERRH